MQLSVVEETVDDDNVAMLVIEVVSGDAENEDEDSSELQEVSLPVCC